MKRWNDIQSDLLQLVFSKLSVADFIRAASVCRAWNYAASYTRKTSLRPSPWLLLRSSEVTKFYSIEESRFYNLNYPLNNLSSAFFPCKFGWLICADSSSLEAFLFNPLTRTQLSLPPVSTIPARRSTYSNSSIPYRKSIRTLYRRNSLSCNPFMPDCAVILCVAATMLVLGRPGGTSWEMVPNKSVPHKHYCNIIFHGGFVCAATKYGNIDVWDLNDLAAGPNTISSVPADNRISCSYYHNLVVTPSGELLMMCKKFKSQVDVLTFKVDLIHKKMEEIRSLGDYSIFTDVHGSICLSSGEVPTMQEGCIYHTKHGRIGSLSRRNDIAVYSPKTRSVEGILPTGDCEAFFRRSWFTPTIN